MEWAVILVQATVACAICNLFSPATVAVSKVYSGLKCLDTLMDLCCLCHSFRTQKTDNCYWFFFIQRKNGRDFPKIIVVFITL